MGYDQVEMDQIVYDTGSSFLVLETVDCTDCVNTYDYTANSDTYTEIADSDMDQTYGDGTFIEGIQVLDWVCMSTDADTCVTDYTWMNIQSYGLGDDLNGILGLALNPTAWDYWTDGPFADSYIDEMFNQGIIGERIFAIAMRDVNDSADSWMDVGFYDETAMDNPDDLVWIESVWDYWWDDYWWQAYMTALRFRE
jgi:hypothetical protein